MGDALRPSNLFLAATGDPRHFWRSPFSSACSNAHRFILVDGSGSLGERHFYYDAPLPVGVCRSSNRTAMAL
jgi:hypothetical protein